MSDDFEVPQVKAQQHARDGHAAKTSTPSQEPIGPHPTLCSGARHSTGMSYNQRQPHSGPAGAPPNMAQDFNAMLQRSMLEPGQPDTGAEAPGRPSSSIGEVTITRQPEKGTILTRLRRIWRCIQCDTTTTTWTECTRRRKRAATTADTPSRPTAPSFLDLRDATGYGGQYEYSLHTRRANTMVNALQKRLTSYSATRKNTSVSSGHTTNSVRLLCPA